MRSNAPENAENWYFNLFGRLLDWEVRNLTLHYSGGESPSDSINFEEATPD